MKKNEVKVILIGDRGIILNNAIGQRVYAEGYYGKPIGINKPKPNEPFKQPLQLSLYELIYLLEKGKITVLNEKNKTVKIETIKKIGKKTYKDFENKYKVYRDLREKGYIVRPGLKFGADFSVYEHGPGIDHAPFLVTVYSKDTKLLGIDLIRAGRLATSVRKKFVIATIKDNKIKYYVFQWHRP